MLRLLGRRVADLDRRGSDARVESSKTCHAAIHEWTDLSWRGTNLLRSQPAVFGDQSAWL